MKKIFSFLIVFLAIFITACNNSAVPTTATKPAPTKIEPAADEDNPGTISTAVTHNTATVQTPSEQVPPKTLFTSTISATVQPEGTDTPLIQIPQDSAPKPKRKLTPNAWKSLPIIPPVSDSVALIYQRGLELGNNPNAYSKIGDCGSTPAWFMGDFDKGPKYYDLGEYQDLDAVIQEFRGSHGRTSLAARSGFNAPSLFVSLWSDPELCEPNESPLECEFRVHRPIVAFIMLGANDMWHADEFEPSMRAIIEYSIENGVIPIISTKADNQEGDGSINDTIAQLAIEYDIPLLNYWLAVQNLPDKGLQEDGVHLTWSRNFFNDPNTMSRAWPVRNLTALQTLDVVWRKATGQNQ